MNKTDHEFTRLEIKKKQAEKRNLLSSFFITLLIGVAFQEMILVLRDEIKQSGFELSSLLLGLIFLFVAIRFFVGNQLHLSSESFLSVSGVLWLYDLLVIIIQSIVLILMGSFSTIEASVSSSIGFYECLIVLYTIDVVWIISQWFLGQLSDKWKRESVPWPWGILNSFLIISFLILWLLLRDPFSINGILWLFILNLLGFVADLVLVDYYDAI